MKAGIHRYQQIFDRDHARPKTGPREDLILKYAPLVKFIADRMAIRVPPNVSREELLSAGTIGLLDALDKFDPEMGIKFQTYAEHRIKGAILDELRKMDWIPRSVRKDIHRLEHAIAALRMRIGRDPEDSEVAREMGVTINAYHRIINRARGIGLLSLDQTLPDGSAPKFAVQTSDLPSPFEELTVKELKKIISQALSDLSEKDQLVISLYYYDELTLKEIAKVVGLTESRISQIHSEVIIKLRAKLRSYYED